MNRQGGENTSKFTAHRKLSHVHLAIILINKIACLHDEANQIQSNYTAYMQKLQDQDFFLLAYQNVRNFLFSSGGH